MLWTETMAEVMEAMTEVMEAMTEAAALMEVIMEVIERECSQLSFSSMLLILQIGYG